MKIKEQKDVIVSFSADEFFTKRGRRKRGEFEDYDIGSWYAYLYAMKVAKKFLKKGEVFLEGDLYKNGRDMEDGADVKNPKEIYEYKLIRKKLPFSNVAKIESINDAPGLALSQNLEVNGLKRVYNSGHCRGEEEKITKRVNKLLLKLKGKKHFFNLLEGFMGAKFFKIWVDNR